MAWRITDYNMQSISHKTEASINREYNRLRKIVEKRVETFEKHGKGNISHAQKARLAIGNNDTIRDRAHAIVDMKNFLSLKQSSYTGYRETLRSTIEYWESMGIEGLNMGNVEQFLSFLEWSRSFYGYTYNAPEMIETWNTKVKTGDLEGLIEFFTEKISGGISNP